LEFLGGSEGWGFSIVATVARVDPWPGHFCMPWVWPKNEKKKKDY